MSTHFLQTLQYSADGQKHSIISPGNEHNTVDGVLLSTTESRKRRTFGAARGDDCCCGAGRSAWPPAITRAADLPPAPSCGARTAKPDGRANYWLEVRTGTVDCGSPPCAGARRQPGAAAAAARRTGWGDASMQLRWRSTWLRICVGLGLKVMPLLSSRIFFFIILKNILSNILQNYTTSVISYSVWVQLQYDMMVRGATIFQPSCDCSMVLQNLKWVVYFWKWKIKKFYRLKEIIFCLEKMTSSLVVL
jgi:hypothetical protein